MSRPPGDSEGTGVGGGPEFGSSGSVPLATSSPSVRPSPSVSGSSGSVPWRLTSSPSLSPSPSVSGSNGSVPRLPSRASSRPSPSASGRQKHWLLQPAVQVPVDVPSQTSSASITSLPQLAAQAAGTV